MLRRHLPTPEEIEQAAAQRQKLRQRRALRAGTAAALAALALLLWADPALQRQTLATAVGQLQSWQLADGSEVRLNTGSRVQVAQHLRSRRLVLDQGEASFEGSHAFWHGWVAWLRPWRRWRCCSGPTPRCSARPWRQPWASSRAGNWPMAARCG